MLLLDVRCKLFLFVIINFVSFAAKDLLFGSIIFSIVLLLSFLIGQYRAAFKYTLYYGILLSLITLCTHLPSALSSLISMFSLFIRMFLPIILSVEILVMTTAVSELLAAMYYFRIPRSFAVSFAVAMRFFPTIREEFENIKDAMRLRGLDISMRNLIRHPIRCYETALIPLMMRAATISEELSAASVSRGIDNPAPRSSFQKLHMTGLDVLFTLVFSLLLIGILAIKQFI